jgi:type IX secretion system PorP/SprF family membrane protein
MVLKTQNKKTTMKKLFLLLIVVSTYGSFAQQDPQYNMYQFNQMIINPAYAGSRDGVSAVASHRQQWVGFDGAPQTTCLSVHGPILKKNLGVGLTIYNDKMGPRNLMAFYGNVAYMLKINKKMKLSFGVNAGYNRYQFNFGMIKFKEGEVPSQLLQTQNPGALDLNTGLYFKTQSFFVGLSATHLNAPNVYTYQSTTPGGSTFSYRLKTHLFLTIGKSFIVDKNVIFAPTSMVKMVGNKVAADLNFNFFLYKKVWLGAFYRAGYGPGGLIQYYVNNKFRIAYSFDSGISDARRLGGSHEVSLGFDFIGSKPSNAKTVNPRFL